MPEDGIAGFIRMRARSCASASTRHSRAPARERAIALPRRLRELLAEEIDERANAQRHQLSLRHHGMDARFRDRIRRQDLTQTAAAQIFADVPGRMQCDAESTERGIAQRFASVAGRDTFAFCKPDPRHLTMTIEMAKGDPKRAVMIGDSRTDIATARAAGIPSICVPFGYTDVPIETLEPDFIIQHFDELPAAVARALDPVAIAS